MGPICQDFRFIGETRVTRARVYVWGGTHAFACRSQKTIGLAPLRSRDGAHADYSLYQDRNRLAPSAVMRSVSHMRDDLHHATMVRPDAC